MVKVNFSGCLWNAKCDQQISLKPANFFVNAENILKVFLPLSHLGGKHPDEVVQPVEHLLKSIKNQKFKIRIRQISYWLEFQIKGENDRKMDGDQNPTSGMKTMAARLLRDKIIVLNHILFL